MVSTLRYRFVLKLVFRSTTSPLVHVGSGFSLGAEVLQVLKVTDSSGRYVYLIPSHSIKGVLRRISELIAKESALSTSFNSLEYALMRAHCEVEGEGLRHVCSNEQDLRVIRKYVDSVLSNEAEATKYVPKDSLEEVRRSLKREGLIGTREVEPILATKCPICRLYGGPGLGGKVFIPDVVLREGRSVLITRTSIERATSKVREVALFTLEALILPEFEVAVIIEDLVPGSAEAKIIAGTLEWLANVGLELGGMKSVGLGHYVLDGERSKACLIDYRKYASREDFLEKLVDVLGYAERRGRSVSEAIKKLRSKD